MLADDSSCIGPRKAFSLWLLHGQRIYCILSKHSPAARMVRRTHVPARLRMACGAQIRTLVVAIVTAPVTRASANLGNIITPLQDVGVRMFAANQTILPGIGCAAIARVVALWPVAVMRSSGLHSADTIVGWDIGD